MFCVLCIVTVGLYIGYIHSCHIVLNERSGSIKNDFAHITTASSQSDT